MKKKYNEYDYSSLKLADIFYYSRLILYRLRLIKFHISNSKFQYLPLLITLVLGLIAIYFLYDTQDFAGSAATIFSKVLNYTILFLFVLFVISLFRSSFNYTLLPRFFKENNLKPLSKSKSRSLLPPSIKDSDFVELQTKYSFEIDAGKSPMQLLQARVTGEKLESFLALIVPNIHFVMIRIELDARNSAPHFYLDNTLNGKSLMRLKDAKPLPLEGNFEDYYELHHEIGYEEDVRYILSPDTMSDLQKQAYPYDIEGNENVIWVIAKGYCMSSKDIKSLIEFSIHISSSLDRYLAK